MPSTVAIHESDTRQEPGQELQASEPGRKSLFVDFPSSKLNSMKTFGSKIKAETKRLISYPGKASKRDTSDENGEETEDNERVNEDFSNFFKEHDILMEFKYVCQDPPSGVYVIPSIKSIQVWHGIVFIRAGPFSEGIFRFDILLPDNFPACAPLVRFTSHIFHPQIHVNGVLNIEQAFPCWKKGKNHISDVLKYLKSCFYTLNTHNALNQDAAASINNDLGEFKATAQECVEESLRRFQEESGVTSDDDGNLLKIRSFSAPLLKEWKQRLFTEDSSTCQ